MEHSEVNDLTEIEDALIKPDILHESDYDENVSWYFKYNKKRKEYLMVSVKYLNGTGYIITAYYTSKTY